MRSSSYNIAVNVDKEKEVYAIINSYTQAFDLVNYDIYEFLKGRGNLQSISESTLDKLVKRGYITSLSKTEEIELVKQLIDKTQEQNQFKLYNFHFILSYDCNLRCVYCYEDDILNSTNALPKGTITKEYIDKAFEIITKKHEKNQTTKVINLYGGEPFLAENYELISYITEKGKQIDHKFKVTSNGYDLDKYFDLLEANKIFSFQITLDGVEEIQNQRKPHFKNNDSFKKITNNVDHLLKLGIPVVIRINTDSDTLKRINELLSYFENRGWYNYKNFSAYWALLRVDVTNEKSTGPKVCEMCNSNQNKPLNQLDFLKHYDKTKAKGEIDKHVFCQDYGIYEKLKKIILGKENLFYKSTFCGAQTGNRIFDPFGDIYSCWDVVGRTEHKIGHYIPDFQIYPDAIEKWFYKNISNYKCVKCKYNLFCGGGCIIKSRRENGKIEPGNCDDFPQIFNYSIKKVYNNLIKDKS
jgi:uncharacterized protein